jgi:hypothetical protein
MHNIPEYATLSPSVSNGAPRKSDFATGQFIAQISALSNFFTRISAARQTLRRSYSVSCCGSPRIAYFSGFSSWPGLTRPSTRTRNHAIKAMIMLPKSETARKSCRRCVDSRVKPRIKSGAGHDAEVRVFQNHLNQLRNPRLTLYEPFSRTRHTQDPSRIEGSFSSGQ